ncbi:uncharacterized protein cubi_02799 [Cryptosporidium ubiquitum]|uniref:Uncharacterized protein n=1 Tax=Cryptosporidium ubiquitum TaxID=857276 RepID=A0A1J4MMB4_9CRYT|nr:uncharacterized protein cubi_02799 [Cryptosporidium ubiquitum]OII73997.1 hypothetical protein cubi_02799 [Cryptosporidium ubiquitum]
MWLPFNALRSKKLGFLVVFLLSVIFLDVNRELFKNVKNGVGYIVEASESSSSPSMTRLDAERKRKHPETAKLPRYPIPGMRYDELSESDSNVHGKKKSGKSKKKVSGASKIAEEGEKKTSKKKKTKSGVKSKKSSKRSTSSGSQEEIPSSRMEKPEKSSGTDSARVKHKSSRSSKHKSSSSNTESSPERSRKRHDKSKLTMSEYKSFLPGVSSIWQHPSTRKTFKHLNTKYGNYFPKIATRPYRKSNECSSLFDSAKKAYENKEIVIHPAEFVGLSLTLASKLREVLGQYVTIQESCLMLRILLHLYSGMRTRTQFLNIIAAVLQNDILLGRISDDFGMIKEVMYILDFLLQLPKHRADTKSMQMSAIEISEFFHLEVYPKDNSYESKLLPIYRKNAEVLMSEIEKRLGIAVARDEIMSMIYIMLNFIEDDRSQEQCTEIMLAVIGATYTTPLNASQMIELSNIAKDVLGCKASSSNVMSKEQIINIFGPEKDIVDMRQTTLVGGPMSDTLRIWKEVGTLDYLGRVISVRFNDCHGLKAWKLNRICSMMEIMNRKLIKTGSTHEIITLEELCGALRYKARHSGTGWPLAIKATLQQRQNSLSVKVEKLFSHFLAHEKRKLASLEGSKKRRREVFYMVPEFSKPSFLDSVTPSSPAKGIPSADPYKPDFFYTFNSMPSWVQNRFIFASAFMEELLTKYGNFVHISPVKLYNTLGGKLDKTSDLSLVIKGLSLTQEQFKALPAAFCDYEEKMLFKHNSNSSQLTYDEFLEAFYEYSLAKYVEGRYFIEAAVDVTEIMDRYLTASNGLMVEIFQQLVTQERLSRVYLFQAFINNRIKVYSNENNINFITTEQSNRILSGCVDNSKLSYVAEMRKSLSPTFFTDNMIEILAKEWSDYENIILPQVLNLNSSEENILQSIYSSGITFAVLSIDGWELLLDPTVYLRNLANGVSLSLNYVTNSLQTTGTKENRLIFIYYWLQQYFIYKLRKIPRFNLEEIRTLVEALKDQEDLSKDMIQTIIPTISDLALSNDLIEDFSYALEAYAFYEKYFIFAKNLDLEGSFATDIGVVNGKLYIPSYIWSFIKDRDDDVNSDIDNLSIIHFSETTLAYFTRMFVTQPHNQDFFIRVLEWANRQNINDDSIFSIALLNLQDFQTYIQHNTKFGYNLLAFLIPWVDHYPSNYHFRRLRSLPTGTSPGFFSPEETKEPEVQPPNRSNEILSEIERLSLEHKNIMSQLDNQMIKEESAMLVVEKIRNDIYILLSELKSVSSQLVSSAVMILSNRKITPFINTTNVRQLNEMGLKFGEYGNIIFDERIAEKGLTGLFVPALVLGNINLETGILEQPPPGFDPEFSCSTQNINRMQAFRLWWNSVLPKMAFHCSDPLLSRDLQSVENLLPIFTKVGFSMDSSLISSSLLELTTSYPFPMDLKSMTAIVDSFLKDEEIIFLTLNLPVDSLENAYRDLRMIEGFYNKKATVPLLDIPTAFSFTPNLEIPGNDNLDRTQGNSLASAKVNFLDYLERITVEYFASSPRRMPTIGIPRLTNLAMNFSSNFDQLVFLISSIFGPMSPYISAPSIGASAAHLADFYIMKIPFSEIIDDQYIEREFKNSLLEFGSPLGKVTFTQNNLDDKILNFRWNYLSDHFFQNDEKYFTSFLVMAELIQIALNYASSKTGVFVSLNSETQRQISFSFITGQNLLEVFRTNIDLSNQNLSYSLENKFYSVLAKSFSFIISQLRPFLDNSDNRSLAEGILQNAISDIYTKGFYPENVRHELINRITLFIDFDSDKYQAIFSDLEVSLNSSNISLPKNLSSHPSVIAQRFLTQRSEANLLSGQNFVSRTPICNFVLTFAHFLTKVLDKPQNKNKIGNFDSFYYSNLDIWSDVCGVNKLEYVNYRSVFLSIIKNISFKLGSPLSQNEINRFTLLMDFFNQNIREIILKQNPSFSKSDSNEIIFSDLNTCLAAIETFFTENDLNIDEIQISNSESLAFTDYFTSSHFYLFSKEEESQSRIKYKSMLENLFISNIQSDLENIPGIKRQISKNFLSDEPLNAFIDSNNILMEKLSDLYKKLPFKFKERKLKSGKKEQSSITFSYLDVEKDQYKDNYDLEGSFLHGKKIACVNRAVLFQHWWLLVWPKIPFYTNDFVLGELLSRLEILTEAFQNACMFTSSEIIFSSIGKLIAGISGVSLKKNHIYIMIETFLDFENKALEFSGAKDLESAYSFDIGMLNSMFSIEHKIPPIPIPKGYIKVTLISDLNNLAQYLFRIISEYFAASPRNYPTILIPNTLFLAEHFDLEKENLTYIIYIWSDLESENSIRSFFQAPTIGASFEDLADFIIENFKLNFLNVGYSIHYLQFFSDPLFSTFFKFGSPLFRVKNINLEVRCSREEESCNPFIPKFALSDSRQKLLEENLSLIITKSFTLTSNKMQLPPDSEIFKFFFVSDVADAIMLGINVLDAVRVLGFGDHKLQVSIMEINKFSVLFSKIFSRIFSSLLESFNAYTYFKKPALNLNFNQMKTLSAKNFNLMSQFASELMILTVLSNDELKKFFSLIYIDDLFAVETYQAFYGITTSDYTRGMITVHNKAKQLTVHLQIIQFNYLYCFILFLIHIFARAGLSQLHISFRYHYLLSFENVIRATIISNQEGVAGAVFALISHKDRFSLGNFTLDKFKQVYLYFKNHVTSFFNGIPIQLVFASSEALIPFIKSFDDATKNVKLDSFTPVTYLNEFQSKNFPYYFPKSQSLSPSFMIEDILNNNSHRNMALLNFQETSFVTGSFFSPWVPFLIGLETVKHSYIESEASDDRLLNTDPGHVYLRRKIKSIYTLNQNLDLTLEYNSLVDLGSATLESGIISYQNDQNTQNENQYQNSLNGLKVSVLNRAVLFREWFIRVWDTSPAISRDPIIIEFLNDFESIIKIFNAPLTQVSIISTNLISYFVSKMGIYLDRIIPPIINEYINFEEKMVTEFGYKDLSEVLESGVAGLLLFSLPISDPLPRNKCHIKNKVWGKGLDSFKRFQILDYATQKLTEYLSTVPRSALTISIPDVSIILDNFSENQPEITKCAIAVWAKDRPDLISAPSLGLDPDSIFDFMESFLSTRRLDQDNFEISHIYQLSYGLLDEYPIQDFFYNYNAFFVLRGYDSFYNEAVGPLISDKATLDAITDVLKLISANVLDTYEFNYYSDNDQDDQVEVKKKGEFYVDLSNSLDYKTFTIRMLMGVSESFSTRKLFQSIGALNLPKDLNKISSDFIRKISVLKVCVYEYFFENTYEFLFGKLNIYIQKSGYKLTQHETFNLFLNHIFVLFSKNLVSDLKLISDCFSEYKFQQRPNYFSTIPDLGPVSQQTGLVISAFNNFKTEGLETAFVPQINLLVFYLKSLNSLINHPGNKFILSIPASINFMSTNMLLRLSGCDLITDNGFSCLAGTIMNSLIDLGSDVGNLTQEALKEILASLFKIVGEISYASYTKLDSEIKYIDPIKNRSHLASNLSYYNSNLLSILFGNLENLEEIINSEFRQKFVNITSLSKSLNDSYKPDHLTNTQLLHILGIYNKGYFWSLSDRLYNVPAFFVKRLATKNPLNLDEFFDQMGVSGILKVMNSVFPTLLKVSVLKNGDIESINNKFKKTNIVIANRAAMFHSFVHITTYPYSGDGNSCAILPDERSNRKGISLEESIRFFSSYNGQDVLGSVFKIWKYFNNIEFYKAYQLLDAFYAIEKRLFGLDALKGTPHSVYSDAKRVFEILRLFLPIILDLEIPEYEGEEAKNLGRIIMLLGRRFFTEVDIKNELTLEKSIKIARHFWPLEWDYYFSTLKRSSVGYYAQLSVLENLKSIRRTPKLAQEFMSFVNEYIYDGMGSDPGLRYFSDYKRVFVKREKFLKKAFSKPFVCSEEDLPWVHPRMEYSGISFPQFNFMMYVITAWKTYVESVIIKKALNINGRKWSRILKEARPGLISILDSFSRGNSLVSPSSLSLFTNLAYKLLGEGNSNAFPSKADIKKHFEVFLTEIQRFSRIRHPGTISTSFMWPAIDCEASTSSPALKGDTDMIMVVPGLTFPMVLNNISSMDRSARKSSKASKTRELLIDSLGEFFSDHHEGYFDPEDNESELFGSETDEGTDDQVQEEIRKGIKLEDLTDHEDDNSSLATDNE